MSLNRPMLVLACLSALAVGACQPSNHPALGGAGMDLFTPVKMRLHPLSRIAASAKVPAVEARIELTDQFGDVGKGAGTLSFKLFAYSALIPSHKGAALGQWEMPLLTPADNREHWDAITRTYLFSLPLQGATPSGKTLLIASITLPNGSVFTDDITLPAK